MFHYDQLQQIARAPPTARNHRLSPMPAYRTVAGQGQSNSKKRADPPHEIKIIQQTVVVNKNPNGPPSGAKQSQKPASGSIQKNTRRNMPSQRPTGRRMGRFRSGNTHGVAALPQGVHILPNLQWLRNSAVMKALRRKSPARSRTRTPQNKLKSGSSNGKAKQRNNPTSIIIYRNGKKQPIVIRAHGHVTLSRTKASGGKSNIVISKTPSKSMGSQSSAKTTTTLKPGEDPPEVENEIAVR